jgi:Spy/CpxP family protein refolding chaperone
MKKFVIAGMALLAALTLSAQNQGGNREGGWQKPQQQYKFSKEDVEKFKQNAKDRIQSEHIAYLTTELELTPEEAEKFWPIYNKAHQEQMDNNQDYRKALKNLKTAVKEGKSESEVKAALDAYNQAKNSQRNVLADYQKDFIKIIGVVKTAKLYVAEDSFRTRQIHNLTGGRGHQPKES